MDDALASISLSLTRRALPSARSRYSAGNLMLGASSGSRVSTRVSRQVRSRSFGRDPATFDRARLRYPPRVYEILTKRCGLHPGTVAFEIGPGTGIATRELLQRGAAPMTLVEPDRRLARYLIGSLGSKAGHVTVLTKTFEDASLPFDSFDLGIAASSFHWTPERRALRKIARILKPGGWWATWSHRHGDPFRSNAFHEALQPLYRTLSNGRAGTSFDKAAATKDRADRIAALKSIGKFDHISREDIRWTVTLTTAQVSALWGTFSDQLTLPPRKRAWFLDGLAMVVDDRFGGQVDLPVLTPVYTARKS